MSVTLEMKMGESSIGFKVLEKWASILGSLSPL